MKEYTIRNWSTKESIVIQSADYLFENYQHTFMKIEDKKLLKCSYSSKMWDVVDVKYQKT